MLLLIGARGGSSEWVPCRRQGIEEWRRFLPWNRRLHGAREAGTLTLAQRHGPGILPVGVHRTFARRAERAGLVNRGCWLTVHDVCRGAFMDWGVQQSRHRELEARTGQVEECWGGGVVPFFFPSCPCQIHKSARRLPFMGCRRASRKTGGRGLFKGLCLSTHPS